MSSRTRGDTTDALPRRLGRYVLLTRLTEGGMTQVYSARLAEEVGPGRMLVIKVLPGTLAGDPEAEARFLAEARIVLNLTHGNITTAFEFGRDESGRPFLVMEYVPGPSLRGLLNAVGRQGDRIRVADALFIIAEVAKALSYAHNFTTGLSSERGVLHRDISPDNIILSTAGQVKITDFGIAHFIEARTVGPIFGKAAYIAPEVIMGAPPSGTSDIYSAGIVLYEALAGVPPFKGSDDRETLSLVTRGSAHPLGSVRGDVSEALSLLGMSLISREAAARPRSAAEMEVLLRASLRATHPAYTEADLAETISRYFSPSDFMDPTPRESLMKALSDAGMAVSGGETTDELLENRTVPLAGGDAASREARPRSRGGGRGAWLSISGVVAIGAFGAALLWLRPGAEQPAPAVREGVRAVTAPPAPPLSRVAIHPGDAGTASVGRYRDQRRGSDIGGRPATRETPPRQVERRAAGRQKQPAATNRSVEWGWLNINSYPWSYVSVDGEKLPGHTPLRRVKLPAGRRHVVFENPELGLTERRVVEVVAGAEINLGVRLE